MTAQNGSIDFTVGSRRLLRVPRKLRPVHYGLNEISGDLDPEIPTLGGHSRASLKVRLTSRENRLESQRNRDKGD